MFHVRFPHKIAETITECPALGSKRDSVPMLIAWPYPDNVAQHLAWQYRFVSSFADGGCGPLSRFYVTLPGARALSILTSLSLTSIGSPPTNSVCRLLERWCLGLVRGAVLVCTTPRLLAPPGGASLRQWCLEIWKIMCRALRVQTPELAV